MATLIRRASSALFATVLIGTIAAEPAFAQVTPGSPTVGPAGGTPSTTAPSNSAGTPSGGTGVISTTRVGPSTPPAAAPVATPSAAPAPVTPARRRVRIRRSPTGAGSSAGLNGSNATSH